MFIAYWILRIEQVGFSEDLPRSYLTLTLRGALVRRREKPPGVLIKVHMSPSTHTGNLRIGTHTMFHEHHGIRAYLQRSREPGGTSRVLSKYLEAGAGALD